MTALVAERAAEVVAAAQRLLAKRLGAPVKLVDPVVLGGSGRTVVLRVRVADKSYALPRTLIVKKVPAASGTSGSAESQSYEPGVASVDSAFLREAISYQFATALAKVNRPGPELLAHDLDGRLLILSDLGEDSRRLTQVLKAGGERTAGNALMAFAQALGRLHAATVGREADFTALMRRAEVAHRIDGITLQARASIAELPPLLDQHLHITVPTHLVKSVQSSLRLFGRSRFRAFSASELCPDNIIVNDDGIRFLDYEWGGFRDATLDIASAIVSFPGCLCHYDLTRDRAQGMVEAWRSQVVGVWPHFRDDDLLATKIVDAQLVWVWLSTNWFLPDDHGRIASAREHPLSVPRSHALISRWEALADNADIARRPEIADPARRIADALDRELPG